jgi:D-tagatose-1,6-bisphosphate aldolase subunit GatZ/KbaZ
VLDQAMCRDPRHWRPYLPGDDEHELRLRRQYGLSDRARYYWPAPEVQQALRRLFANLEGLPLSRGLLGQYLPDAVDALAGGTAVGLAPRLARLHVRGVLRRYASACSPGPGVAVAADAALPIR